MRYILRNDASSMYIVYMGALMAGFGLNFFLTWVICMYQKKWSHVEKRMCVWLIEVQLFMQFPPLPSNCGYVGGCWWSLVFEVENLSPVQVTVAKLPSALYVN